MENMFSKIPSLQSTFHLTILRQLFAGSLESGKFAVAISGGPDSVALCALLKELYPNNRIVGLFVNHNLSSRGITESDEVVAKIFDQFGTFSGRAFDPMPRRY